jgi:alanine racemase
MEIRADALRANLERIRRAVGPDAVVIPMIKADGYGLGVQGVVEALSGEDVHGFGVATVEEGACLRELGVVVPVVVLSPVPPGSEEAAVRAELEVSVSNLDTLARLAEASATLRRKARCHVEIDTGMGRAGFDAATATTWAPAVRTALGPLDWVGCFTHLHSADSDAGSVDVQWRSFQDALDALHPPASVRIHVLNSAGVFCRPGYASSAVRPGIFLYGGGVGGDAEAPEPVMALRARVVHVREAPPGTTLGYGATYRSSGQERWATVSIGYGDGLPRCLGNRGAALLRGRRVPIVGRISMDVTVVDISHVPDAELGDVVTFVGRDGGGEIALDEVATLADTISYEILTGITARVARIWVNG